MSEILDLVKHFRLLFVAYVSAISKKVKNKIKKQNVSVFLLQSFLITPISGILDMIGHFRLLFVTCTIVILKKKRKVKKTNSVQFNFSKTI